MYFYNKQICFVHYYSITKKYLLTSFCSFPLSSSQSKLSPPLFLAYCNNLLLKVLICSQWGFSYHGQNVLSKMQILAVLTTVSLPVSWLRCQWVSITFSVKVKIHNLDSACLSHLFISLSQGWVFAPHSFLVLPHFLHPPSCKNSYCSFKSQFSLTCLKSNSWPP